MSLFVYFVKMLFYGINENISFVFVWFIVILWFCFVEKCFFYRFWIFLFVLGLLLKKKNGLCFFGRFYYYFGENFFVDDWVCDICYLLVCFVYMWEVGKFFKYVFWRYKIWKMVIFLFWNVVKRNKYIFERLVMLVWS